MQNKVGPFFNRTQNYASSSSCYIIRGPESHRQTLAVKQEVAFGKSRSAKRNISADLLTIWMEWPRYPTCRPFAWFKLLKAEKKELKLLQAAGLSRLCNRLEIQPSSDAQDTEFEDLPDSHGILHLNSDWKNLLTNWGNFSQKVHPRTAKRVGTGQDLLGNTWIHVHVQFV